VTERVVYQHVRLDTGAVFYVGKGKSSRATERSSRNVWWRRIVAKAGGFEAHVVGVFDSDEEAFEVERALIAHYGKGRLCNLTAGGEGASGLSPSAATRALLSAAVSGERHPNWGKRLSDETRRRKSESMKASPKNLRGRKLPDWWREKIRVAKCGAGNPMFGRTGDQHPRSRAVVDDATGTRYPSVTAAARMLGTRMQTLHNMLTGFRPNGTSLRFA